MTSQGTPLTRYHRAIEAKSIRMTELTAREMSWLPLREALALLALYAEQSDPKYEKAAVRWLVRLAVERPDLGLQDVQLVAFALGVLPSRAEAAMRVLVDVTI